ncbi:retinol dehydrogenase 11-like [Tautogolabrus adspersus]
MLLELLLFGALLVGLYFLLHVTVLKMPRCKSDVKLNGKTVIVTGANTGIGKTTAMDLARRGARVIMACRDRGRAEAAIKDIIQETGNNQVVFMQLDLSSQKSVRSFVENFLRSESRLDLLINNAGLITKGMTEDGFGMIFGVNHLGHFLLTVLLLDRLKASGPSRVVTVSSDGHKGGKVDFNCLKTHRVLSFGDNDFQLLQRYCHSKLCNVLFTIELAKRLQDSDVTCYSLHPGGNTGIGKATALHLARKGARVILACRNRNKAEAAIAEIQQGTGSTNMLYMQLDLASLKSVHCFTETFLKSESKLDLLINNAGLVGDGRTAEGFGIQFGVNHLGHFLLTVLLLERLKEAGGGRVVTLSSMAHRWGHIDFDALAANKDLGTGSYSWQFFMAYCSSKLCNVLFTHELAKRLKGTNVTCYSVHPGVVRTELSRHVSLWQKVFIEPIAHLLFLDPEAGAQTTLHCCLQEGIEHLSGRYFFCCAEEEVCAQAKDDGVARKLWDVSEKLCGLS